MGRLETGMPNLKQLLIGSAGMAGWLAIFGFVMFAAAVMRGPAAGAIEAIVSILSIRHGCVPPTINLVDPDPEAAGMDLTPNQASRHEIRTVLSNSFGFGGQNTALVFTRWAA